MTVKKTNVARATAKASNKTDVRVNINLPPITMLKTKKRRYIKVGNKRAVIKSNRSDKDIVKIVHKLLKILSKQTNIKQNPQPKELIRFISTNTPFMRYGEEYPSRIIINPGLVDRRVPVPVEPAPGIPPPPPPPAPPPPIPVEPPAPAPPIPVEPPARPPPIRVPTEPPARPPPKRVIPLPSNPSIYIKPPPTSVPPIRIEAGTSTDKKTTEAGTSTDKKTTEAGTSTDKRLNKKIYEEIKNSNPSKYGFMKGAESGDVYLVYKGVRYRVNHYDPKIQELLEIIADHNKNITGTPRISQDTNTTKQKKAKTTGQEPEEAPLQKDTNPSKLKKPFIIKKTLPSIVNRDVNNNGELVGSSSRKTSLYDEKIRKIRELDMLTSQFNKKYNLNKRGPSEEGRLARGLKELDRDINILKHKIQFGKDTIPPANQPENETPPPNQLEDETPISVEGGFTKDDEWADEGLDDQEGSGLYQKIKDEGLSNHDINFFAEQLTLPKFIGVYGLDQLETINTKPPFTAIFNTAEYPKTGHWIALLASPIHNGQAIIEVYDSFGRDLKSVRQAINKLIKRLYGSTPVQLKYNIVKHQDVDSNTCGYFCLQFLHKRKNGQNFKQATGFDKIEHLLRDKQGEEKLEKFKNRLEDFKLRNYNS